MNRLEGLLDEVSRNTQALKAARLLYGRQLAPNFNIFEYISTNEIGLSKILADLLNPQGNHDQQEQFLRLFIEYCLPDLDVLNVWNPFIENIDKVKVITEEVTSKINALRRMDIYLEYKADNISYGICIENKPYAIDQYRQLEDYAKELKERHKGNWHIVYLNEYNSEPSKNSVNPELLEEWKKYNQFSSLKYSNLVRWLKACQIESQNHSVTEFIGQLLKFIQQQFMGIKDMNETNMIIDIIQSSSDAFESSFKIANTIYELKKQLIFKLKSDLENSFLESEDYTLDLSNIGEGSNYEQVNLKIRGNDKAYISFEFQNANFNRPYIGIKFDSAEEAKVFAHSQRMKDVLNKRFLDKKIEVSSLWPAGYWFEYQDWKSSYIPWLMIKNGEMAPVILNELENVYFALKESGCLE